MSILLNQESTGNEIVPAWALPGIAPALYMLGTELGLTELRRAVRKLRSRAGQAVATATVQAPLSKKEIVLAVLCETEGRVPEALAVLKERGVRVDAG